MLSRSAVASAYGNDRASATDPSSRRSTILVLDDDPLCREVMTLALEQAGSYSLTSTGDPMDAWTLVRSTKFDLLILDVLMPPNKPHGIAVARTTLLSNQKQKVIYVTGSDVPEDRRGPVTKNVSEGGSSRCPRQ
jgi:CheY-like chemotaxis protein